MIVHPVKVSTRDGRCSVSATIEIETPGKAFASTGTSKQELWIDWPSDYFVPSSQDAGAFALVCLPVAMCLNERLLLDDPISQALLINALEAMAIYNMYFPDLCDVIDIEAKSYHPPKSGMHRVGSFYSGGVDSFYNIAECLRLQDKFNTDPVTDLWLIQGMDIKLSDDLLWAKTKTLLQSPFRNTEDLRCVDIRTNAREIHERYVPWGMMGFSAILGGIAKCFSPIVSTALIGSYAKYKDIIPHSSSPLVDPMWSCDQQTVKHFSCRVSRMEKIETIANHAPHLLPNLRVCYLNQGGAYNCGMCEKCLRTQMQLMLCGSLEKCSTFDTPLTPDSLRGLTLPWHKKNQYSWSFWQDIQLGCKDAGYKDFEKAIRRQLLRNRISRVMRRASAGIRSALRLNH